MATRRLSPPTCAARDLQAGAPDRDDLHRSGRRAASTSAGLLAASRVQVGDISDPQLPTTAAFAAAIEAEDGPPPGSMLPAVLRMAARPVQLFAAVDREGSIQATSAAAASGTTGMLWGIGTMHDWRGQGVGTAMTAVAVHGAAGLGATTSR